MRIAACKQMVLVRMSAVELGCLCFLPEIRQLMARFPEQVKVNFLSPPRFFALSHQVIPFVLATTGDAPVLRKMRRSLRAFLENPMTQRAGP